MDACAEQVRNHPPTTALRVESAGFTLLGAQALDVRIRGRCVEVRRDGALCLCFACGEPRCVALWVPPLRCAGLLAGARRAHYVGSAIIRVYDAPVRWTLAALCGNGGGNCSGNDDKDCGGDISEEGCESSGYYSAGRHAAGNAQRDAAGDSARRVLGSAGSVTQMTAETEREIAPDTAPAAFPGNAPAAVAPSLAAAPCEISLRFGAAGALEADFCYRGAAHRLHGSWLGAVELDGEPLWRFEAPERSPRAPRGADALPAPPLLSDCRLRPDLDAFAARGDEALANQLKLQLEQEQRDSRARRGCK